MELVLFFTHGVSLKSWDEKGLLNREKKLYEYLAKYHNVKIKFLTYGNYEDKLLEKKLKFIQIIPVYEKLRKPNLKIFDLIFSLFIPFIFYKELNKADLFKTNQMWGSWVAVLSKWIFKKPLINRSGYELYSFSKNLNKSWFYLMLTKFLSKISYKNSDLINLTTILDKTFIMEEFKIDKRKIQVIPNWIETNHFKKLNTKKIDKVLVVGRLSKQKQIHLLINALKGTSISADIVGTGELQNQLSIIAKKQSINLNFLGNIQNNQMNILYSSYKLFVICSAFEGNPKALLEAMSCEMPIIGTNVEGIKNIIKNGINGILVKQNKNDLKVAIQNIWNNGKLRKKLGKSARKYILNNNDLSKIAQKEYANYVNLLNREVN